jgi:hypothetical protein
MPNCSSIKKRNEQRLRYYKKYQKNNFNSNRRWNGAEKELVLNFDISDVDLHKRLGRSVGAIQIMRCRMKDRNLMFPRRNPI